VDIAWGDGSPDTVLHLDAGVLTFSAGHQYLDNPSGQPHGSFAVTAVVKDKDGDSGSGSASVVVNNVAPASVALTPSLPALNQNGNASVSGSFTDPGTSDAHTVDIAWGDGSPDTVLHLDPGVLTFGASHQYINNPSGQPQVSFPVSATVTDKDGDSGSGGTMVTVNFVIPVNDAPTGANKTVTTLEDTAYVLNPTDFGFSDPNDSPANAFLAVKVTTLPGAGSLTDKGAAVTPGQLIPVADIIGGNFKFAPAPNANGSPYTTFTFQVQDDGGVAYGGVDLDPAPKTFTINVTPVNDAPSFTSGAAQAVLANAGAQTVANWATNISAGPADESGQTLNFIVSNSNNSLFSVQPALAADGTLTFTPAPGGGTATVTVQLHDSGGVANGGVDTSAAQTFVITVTPVVTTPLTLSNVSAGSPINENDTATITGTFTDSVFLTHTLTISWGDWTSSAISTFALGLTSGLSVGARVPSSTDAAALTVTGVNTATGAVGFSVQHQYLQSGPGNGTSPGVAHITVTVQNGTASAAANADLQVNDVAPVITGLYNSSAGFSRDDQAGDDRDGGRRGDDHDDRGRRDGRFDDDDHDRDSRYSLAGEGDGVTVSGNFTDPGTLDRHTVTIDWGDGTVETKPALRIGARSFSYTHAYAQGGIYTVSTTITDAASGTSSVSTTTALVSGASLSNGTLYVIGTNRDDHVSVNKVGSGILRVHADFLSDRGQNRDFSAAGIKQIVVLLGRGDDVATVSGDITTPTIMDGGSGDDTLTGGNGPNILIGGTGDDTLIGGNDRDILIGGFGRDRLVGNGGDDILIAGSTAYDPKESAITANFASSLQAIQAAWLKTGTPVARATAILNGVGLPPGVKLDASTVFQDDDQDRLTGSAGGDWFLAAKREVTDYTASDALFTDIGANSNS
jgi:hypothetical protein